MICVAPASPSREHIPHAPFRANPERPLWFVRTTRSAADWARCESGRRLDAETADLLLDHVFECLAVGEVADGIAYLLDGLGRLCDGDRACWRRFARTRWAIHPISALVWQDDVRAAIAGVADGDRGFAALMSLLGPDFFLGRVRTPAVGRLAR